MTIIEKNSGPKIPYSVIGNVITFDDDLSLNLEKREEDNDVHIDICYDSNRTLVIGAAAGREYVAQIDIPARKYTDAEEETEEPSSIPVPFDIDNITLSLFAIE